MFTAEAQRTQRLKKKRRILLVLLMAVVGRGEVVDRIAVTVDQIVITDSDIVRQIRVAALLDGGRADLGASARRQAAGRLIELALIRREMALSRYPEPAAEEIEQQLAQQRNLQWRAQLTVHSLTEEDVRESLSLVLMTLRFIRFRFRPGIAAAEEEIEQYYQQKFLPEWRKTGTGTPPALEDTRADIERILIDQRVDEALAAWLAEARAQARIVFREEAFR